MVSVGKKMACLDAILFRKRSGERERERGREGEGAAVPVIVSLLEVESHSPPPRIALQHIEFQFA